MGVLLVHVNQVVAFPGILGSIASFGADGVKCFFFLTGYLVMASWQNRKSTKDYWRKRLARTIPIYYFFLLLFIVFRFGWMVEDPWAIPRAAFMLQYVAPPTVSYSYCSMYLLGVLSIFMSFYIAIPFLAKWLRSLDSAFVGFWGIVAFSVLLNKAYIVLYGQFCPLDAVQSMAKYYCNAIPYFAVGIMTYFGKREDKPVKLLAYSLFIAIFGMRYTFLDLTETGWVCLLFVILLCYPPKVMGKITMGGQLWQFDRVFGMGVFISQYWCFAVVNILSAFCPLPNGLRAVLMVALPYFAAYVIYYAVEKPGAKAINWLFDRVDRKKVRS